MAVAAAWGIPRGTGLDDVVRDPSRSAHARALLPTLHRQRRVMERVAGLAASALGVTGGMVTIVTADEIHIVGASITMPACLPIALGPCPFVLAHGAPLAVRDTARDPIARHLACLWDGGLHAYAGVPIRSEGLLVGTVAVVDDAPHRFSRDDLELLSDLAAAVEHQLGRPEPALPA